MILENGYKLHFPPNLQFSDDEFFEFCQKNQELNIERDADQNIIIMSLTGSLSGKNESIVLVELGIWNKMNQSGHIFSSSTGFNLPDSSMRSPDASWVSNEQWDQLTLPQKQKFAPVTPEFVVEIKSPSDSLKELQMKMEEYINNGVKLGWLIDVEQELVFIYSPKHTPKSVTGFDQTLKADDTLPGFELDLSLLKSN